MCRPSTSPTIPPPSRANPHRERYALPYDSARLAAVLLCFGGARAQVAWEAPLLLPPAPPAGAGLYLIDATYGKLGVLGTYRPGGSEVGFRLGVVNDRNNDVSVFGGIDLARLAASAGTFPLDIGWAVGVGAGVGRDGVIVGVPAQLSLGHRFSEPEVAFTPYVAPRVTLDLAMSGSDSPDPGAGTHLGVSVDLGVDIDFRSGWLLRFAGSAGDHGAVAIGVSF